MVTGDRHMNELPHVLTSPSALGTASYKCLCPAALTGEANQGSALEVPFQSHTACEGQGTI